MYCPRCRRVNSETARFCGNCGETLQQQGSRAEPEPPPPSPPPPTYVPEQPVRDPGPDYEPFRGGAREYEPFRGTEGHPPKVPNYLVQAILVTLFCCVPFGIVAIVYAAQVNGKVALGDLEGAWRTSRSAKNWAWISFGVGLVITVGWVIFLIVGGTGAEPVAVE